LSKIVAEHGSEAAYAASSYLAAASCIAQAFTRTPISLYMATHTKEMLSSYDRLAEEALLKIQYENEADYSKRMQLWNMNRLLRKKELLSLPKMTPEAKQKKVNMYIEDNNKPRSYKMLRYTIDIGDFESGFKNDFESLCVFASSVESELMGSQKAAWLYKTWKGGYKESGCFVSMHLLGDLTAWHIRHLRPCLLVTNQTTAKASPELLNSDPQFAAKVREVFEVYKKKYASKSNYEKPVLNKDPKYPEHAFRLAAVLSRFDDPERDVVTFIHLEMSLDLYSYYLEQQKAVFGPPAK